MYYIIPITYYHGKGYESGKLPRVESNWAEDSIPVSAILHMYILNQQRGSRSMKLDVSRETGNSP